MDISLIAMQNPWWTDKEAITRDSKVQAVIKNGERLVRRLDDENEVLIGPRQVGKTTALLYDIFLKIRQGVDPKHIMYFSFDTVKDYNTMLDVLKSFVVDNDKRYVYLDEISFVEDWQRAIKFFLDSSMSKNVKLYATGSSSINLRKELMPGRPVSVKEFLPLSFREFALSQGSQELKQFLAKHSARSIEEATEFSKEAVFYFSELERLFGAYTITGGYPLTIIEYFNNKSISSDTYDIYWNAFLSDISKSGKSVQIASSVLIQVLRSYTTRISLSGVAQSQGIGSHVTVREYLETMHDLFIINEAFALDSQRVPLFRKERKIYFNDPFLFRLFSTKLNVLVENQEAKIVEGIVHQHLYRFANEHRPQLQLGYGSGRREIDFIVGNAAIEVKWQEHVTEQDMPKTGQKEKILLNKTILEYGRVKLLPVAVFLAFL